MSRRPLRILVPVAATAALLMTACSSGSSDADSSATESGSASETTAESDAGEATDGEPITIGVIGAADSQWEVFTEKAEAEGIEVEIVNFSDYQIPNQALADGELDLNQFQHLQFLANYNDATGNDLQPIGATAVYPLNLYSLEFSDLSELPEGAQVAVPNDDTNLARALLNLQQAGLITLVDGGSSFSTAADIIAEESKIEVTPVDATQTAIALSSGSVSAAVINNDFISDAGLTDENVIYADDPSGDAIKPYINVFASRGDDVDNETYLKLVELWHEADVEAAVTVDSSGLAIFDTTSGEDLRQILADIQASRPAS